MSNPKTTIMRIIKPVARGILQHCDIELIAKEMVNIYQGAECYDIKTGDPHPEPKEGYLSWERGSMLYECISHRGYIYIHNPPPEFNKNDKKIVSNLLSAFERANMRFGIRDCTYIDHIDGTSQFTTEDTQDCHKVHGRPAVDSTVVSQNGTPFMCKFRENSITWIVSDEITLFQYSAQGKRPKIQNLLASITTIVVDLNHTLPNFEQGFRTLEYPCLDTARDIHIIHSEIILSQVLGIDYYLYSNIRGSSVKLYNNQLMTIGVRYLVKDDGTRHAYYKVKTLSDLQSIDSKRETTDEACGVCGINIFNQFYCVYRAAHGARAADAIASVAVCKFCAHYQRKIANEMNSGTYDIVKMTSNTSRGSIIEISPVHDQEKHMLHALSRAIDNKMVEIKKWNDTVLVDISQNYGDIVLFGSGETRYIGVPHNLFQQYVLHQVQLLPDHCVVFGYST